MALRSFWSYAQNKTKHLVGIHACVSTCWCSTCGACWSLDNYHKGQACLFYEQVQNMKATMAYIGDKNKRTLSDASPISKEPFELDLDEPSSSKFEPEPSHHSTTEPTSPPGLDRSALFDTSDDSAEDQVDWSEAASPIISTQHNGPIKNHRKDIAGTQHHKSVSTIPAPSNPGSVPSEDINLITLYTRFTLTVYQSIPSKQINPNRLPINLIALYT